MQEAVSREVWEKRDSYSKQRFEQLNALIVDTTTEGIKFLAVINLGGLAATLGFMGSLKVANAWLVGAAAAFMVGVFEVAAVYMCRYFYLAWLQSGWNDDYVKVMTATGKFSWENVVARDRRRTRLPDWGALLAVLSICAFLVGGCSVFLGALSAAKAVAPDSAPKTTLRR